jgi:hypothetical protein
LAELQIKVGNKFLSGDPQHESGWRDGQIIQIRPDGFLWGQRDIAHHAIVRLPFDIEAIDPLELKQWISKADINGKQRWENGFIPFDMKDRRGIRDWFIDFKDLLNNGDLTQEQYNKIYAKGGDQGVVNVGKSLLNVVKREGVDVRKANVGGGTVSSGEYTIGSGSGDDYSTLAGFEADIAATLTGDLTGLHQAEITSLANIVIFDIDTSTYDFVLTANTGTKHGGIWDNNKAGIDFTATWDYIRFDETTPNTFKSLTISDLQLDISGTANIGWQLFDVGDTKAVIERCIVKGTSASDEGISVGWGAANVHIRNNIVYGIGSTTNNGGIIFSTLWQSNTYRIENNTCVGNYTNITQRANTENNSPVKYVNNNLCQNAGWSSGDFYDVGAGFGTTAYNIAEDNTSPDSLSFDKHSKFGDYDNDNYLITTEDSDLDDGQDNSARFTDDITGTTRSTWYIGASEHVPTTYNIKSYTVPGCGTVNEQQEGNEWTVPGFGTINEGTFDSTFYEDLQTVITAVPSVEDIKPNFDTAIKTFQQQAGVGNQTLLFPGLGTIKGAQFNFFANTTDSSVDDGIRASIGYADGTNQFVSCAGADHGSASSNTARRNTTDEVMMRISAAGPGTVLDEANVVSFGNGQIVINWGVNAGSQRYFQVIAFAGSKVSALAGSLTAHNTVDNYKTITPNFRMNCLLMSGDYTSNSDSGTDHLGLAYGCAVDNGTSIDQMFWGFFSRDGQPAADTGGMLVTNRVCGQVTDSSYAYGLEVSDITSTNFRVYSRTAGGASDRYGFLALRIDGGQLDLSVMDIPTSTGWKEYNHLSFKPKFVAMGQTTHDTTDQHETDGTGSSVAMGFMNANGESAMDNICDEQGSDPMDNPTAVSGIRPMYLMQDNGNLFAHVASGATWTLDDDGWSLNYSAVYTYVGKCWALALTDEPAPADSTSSAPGYYYEDLATTIVSAVTLSDLQQYINVVTSTIASSASLVDAQAYIEDLQTTAVVTDTAEDIQAYIEQLSTVATTVSTLEDLQTYADTLQTVAVSTPSVEDAQMFVDILTTTIASIDTLEDQQAYAEDLQTVIVSTATVPDVQTYVDSLTTTIVSVATVYESQTYIDTLTSVIISAVTLTEINHYVETLSTLIQSDASVTDTAQMIENLLTTAIAEATVIDTVTLLENLQSTAVITAAVDESQNYVDTLTTVIESADSILEVNHYVETNLTAILSISTVEERQSYITSVADVATATGSVTDIQAYIDEFITTVTTVAAIDETLIRRLRAMAITISTEELVSQTISTERYIASEISTVERTAVTLDSEQVIKISISTEEA